MDLLRMLALYILPVVVINVEFVLSNDLKQEVIYVKPGAGTLSVEHYLNDYKCKFTYAAQGGTHEEWDFSLELIDGGSAVICTVGRDKQSSYLYFEHFSMEVTGPFVAISEVDIKASQRDNKNLQASEFLQEKNVVSSTAQFKNHLEKVAVYCPFPREDL